MAQRTVFTSTPALVDHLASLGALASDEGADLSELDHALQTAAILQATSPDDLELQVAGLLHDLGHPWDGAGQPRHGVLGAEAVRPLWGRRIAHLVEGHVPAKRYLVATDPGYRARLSDGSVTTLAAQGEAMGAHELAAFAADPERHALVTLRRADDRAKVLGAVVPGLDHWVGALQALAGLDRTGASEPASRYPGRP